MEEVAGDLLESEMTIKEIDTDGGRKGLSFSYC